MLAVSMVSLVVTSTLLDASLGNMAFSTQRAIGTVSLVVPALLGTVFGALGIRRAPQRRALAVASTALNALFALFMASVLAFAG